MRLEKIHKNAVIPEKTAQNRTSAKKTVNRAPESEKGLARAGKFWYTVKEEMASGERGQSIIRHKGVLL